MPWTRAAPKNGCSSALAPPGAGGIVPILTTLALALIAATAGILIALTQAGIRSVGWGWAVWTVVVAWVLGRLIYDALRGSSRRV